VGKAAGAAHCMKGGVGIAVAGNEGEDGVMAAAIVAVNSVGHVRDMDGTIIAGPRGADGKPGDAEKIISAGAPRPEREAGANTTLAVVALNVAMSKVELHQIARAASAAFYRRIGPAGTSFDGDVIFAVSPMTGRTAPLIQAEVIAVAALEEAIVRAVRFAKGRDGIPGVAD
jgi:L-aminopeptidase/D-esterase-like protein